MTATKKKKRVAKTRCCHSCGKDLTATKQPVAVTLKGKAGTSMQLRRPPAVEFTIAMVGNGAPYYYTQTWCTECTERVLTKDATQVMAQFWYRLAQHGPGAPT